MKIVEPVLDGTSLYHDCRLGLATERCHRVESDRSSNAVQSYRSDLSGRLDPTCPNALTQPMQESYEVTLTNAE